jgi:BirA family biotin operon repressor/biotin-[acetyl-CoA-carboxylase] ligase
MVVNLTSRMKLDAFQEGLSTKRCGKIILFKPIVSSTNEWAKKLAEGGVEEGTITLAAQQTAGKGRLGRKWISPKGGLWFSIILYPDMSIGEVTKLVFIASLAVARVLHQKYRVRTETKWPNDVLVAGRKICGILAETSISDSKLSYVVLGIGINANFHPDKYPDARSGSPVTSIQNELGRKIQLLDLLGALLKELERLYDLFKTKGFDPILEQWKKHAIFLKHEVVMHDGTQDVFGRAYDVDDEGALVLELDNGELRRFFTGDLSMQIKST